MTTSGTVRLWNAVAGWGVIDSDSTPGGRWAHFSSVMVAGYKDLRAGQQVRLAFEIVEQDGYSFRTVKVWPSDQDADRPPRSGSGPSSAYSSTLSLRFDAEDSFG